MFVALTARLGAGRSDDDKAMFVRAMMDALTDYLGEATATMMLSVEYQEIDPRWRINENHLRTVIAERTTGDGLTGPDTKELAWPPPPARSTRTAPRRPRSCRASPTRPLLHLIDGQPTPSASGETFDNHSPIDGALLGAVAAGGPADIDAAARAASDAFGDWSGRSGHERKRILHDVADLIVERADEIAAVECVDTGQTVRFMSAAAIRGAENFRFFADHAPDAPNGRSMPDEHHLNYSSRSPLGPVGVITPWNTPFMLSTWKIAPALAAGCTVVHKPAEWSPCTAALLSEIALEAGLPPGVLNTVHGLGESAGRALTEHPLIKAIGFVGESATGSLIQAQAAPTLKRLHFELGGKNPVIVFADADLDRALDAVVFMIYSLNGERCTSSSRLLVQRSIHDEFTERLAERVRALRVGHPLDPATEIGPLIHPVHCDKVRSYVAVAEAEGATVVVGGGDATDPASCYVEPDAVHRGDQRHAHRPRGDLRARAHRDPVRRRGRRRRRSPTTPTTGSPDTSGPATPAGPTASPATSTSGMVWVNSQNVRHLPTPFGGTKASGIGRDGGPEFSFDFYMETKNVAIAYDTHAIAAMGQVR